MMVAVRISRNVARDSDAGSTSSPSKMVPRLIISSVLACALGCDPSGCNQVQTSELRFFRNGSLIFSESTINHATLNATQLQSVASVPLQRFIPEDFLTVDISGDYSLAKIDNFTQGQQIEAHLFVADLVATNDALRAVPVHGDWDTVTLPQHVGGAGVVAFPPNPEWDKSVRYNPGLLFPGEFWPFGVTPATPASAPAGTGSIKSARLYRPGLCGFEQRFRTSAGQDGLFDTISDSFYFGFSTNGSINPGSAHLNFSRITTLLDDGIDIFGPKGGFFFFFGYDATAGPLGIASVTFQANMEYQFTLDDGRVAIVPSVNDIKAEIRKVPTAAPTACDDCLDAVQKTLPDTLHKTFVQRQSLDLIGNGPACDGSADPTRVTRQLLDAPIRQAAKDSFGIPDGDARLDRLSAAIQQPGSWYCDTDSQGAPPTGFAKFILRAKRINVYGDAIELVWFDEVDYDDPMYALYVLAANKRQLDQLCTSQRTMLARGNFPPLVEFRRLVTVSRPDPPDAAAHVFTCGMDPFVNGERVGTQIALNMCADPATPADVLKAACVAQCKAQFADVITEPPRLFSKVTDCAVEAGPTDTLFECNGDASPRYYNGGPAAFHVEGAGAAEIGGGGSVTAAMRSADLTLLPCAGAACAMVFSTVDIVQTGAASLGGGSLSNLEIQNRGLAFGSWQADGSNQFTIPSGALTLGASFDSAGVHTSVEAASPQPMSGTFAPDGSSFVSIAPVSLSGTAATFTLGGVATGHPPVADFTPKGAIECTQPNAAAVTLSGAPSHDPDSDIRFFAWAVDHAVAGSGSTFPTVLTLGPHVVGLDVFDSRGGASEAQSPLAVVDTTPPLLTVKTDPACLWPPDHALVLFQFGNGLNATATDICDPNPKIEIAQVASNQPALGGGSGNTGTDVFFGKTGLCVRAERAGTVSTPRVYTVTVRATDASGNSTTKDVAIQVAHDQAGQPCPTVDPVRIVADVDARCLQ